MSFATGVVAHLRAQHHLVGEFGPASTPHEHTYRVVATVHGAALKLDGTLIDITIVERALAAALADLEGRDLNAIAALADPNPTAEVVARYLFDRVSPALPNADVDRLTIEVWESDSAFASYSATLRT